MKIGAYFRGWIIVGWSALAIAAMTVAVMLTKGMGEDGMRVLTRATARTSFALFISAFVASALHKLWPTAATTWLLQNRRYVGVSFAVSHTFHALAILGLAVVTSGQSLEGNDVSELAGGLLAYLFIAAMVATSFDSVAGWMGMRWWSVLHKAGMYYVWLVFMFSYGGRAVYSSYYAPMALLLLAGVALRLVSARRPKRLAAAKSA